MSSKRSRVHPPYKTKYRVTNWAIYNQALVRRGTLGLWISPDAIVSCGLPPESWTPGWLTLSYQKESHGSAFFEFSSFESRLPS